LKRSDLIRHLTSNDCELLREGARHSVWLNPENGERQAIPRHADLKDALARSICRRLGVPRPPG
jgi:mRNA interferase HicA